MFYMESQASEEGRWGMMGCIFILGGHYIQLPSPFQHLLCQ